MYVFRTVHALRRYLDDQKGRSVGFVPTMGALHAGHISLLEAAQEPHDCTVVSIFVNPTQFNDPGDLAKYPRTTGPDLDVLYAAGCEVVFLPSVEEVYPPDEVVPTVDLAGLDTMMEGEFRPGHFSGVAQVVRRLLKIVRPDALYMGQKDFQQVAVVRHMINAEGLNVSLVMCPTMREDSGLAMSSRNVLLTPENRSAASVIYNTLCFAREAYTGEDIEALENTCLELLSIPHFRPEYFSIVDGHTLQKATKKTRYVVACCAVWAGDVRLIDNMELRKDD